jgi:transcriptional regulator with XRE-family HTH domain
MATRSDLRVHSIENHRIELVKQESLRPQEEDGVTVAKVSIFTRRLKKARLRLGLSQAKLGIKAGIDPCSASTRMCNYERGVSWPNLLIITHIANALEVPLPYLFCKDNDLATLILKFPTLSKDQIKRLLAQISKA